jgi:hypothetical protein
MMMDTAPLHTTSSSSSVDKMMTTERLLDCALGDMVAVSTPRTAADGEEGVWQTVRRVESHPQDNLNLWWSVDAGYLLLMRMSKRRRLQLFRSKQPHNARRITLGDLGRE